MARPREFEPEEALDAIMGVFWRQGYEGTSLQDIEAATGLNKQSLYRIYADKRAMYLAALQRYDEVEMANAAQMLSEPGSARTRLQRLFKAALAETEIAGPKRGCFLCNASADQAQLDPEAKEHVNASMRRMECMLQDALAASAPYDSHAKLRKAVATKLASFYFGLRLLVKAEMPIANLKAAVRQVLDETETA